MKSTSRRQQWIPQQDAISNGLFPPGGQGDGNPLYEVEDHLAALGLSSGAVLQDIVISGSVSSGYRQAAWISFRGA